MTEYCKLSSHREHVGQSQKRTTYNFGKDDSVHLRLAQLLTNNLLITKSSVCRMRETRYSLLWFLHHLEEHSTVLIAASELHPRVFSLSLALHQFRFCFSCFLVVRSNVVAFV